MADEYRVTTFATEVLHSGVSPSARASTFALEVLHDGPTASARVTAFAFEVLRTPDSISSSRRRQIVNS